MPKKVLKNPIIKVDGVELQRRSSSVTVEWTDDEVDGTAFGAKNKETLKGLGDASIQVTFQQDFAVGSVDDTLSDLKNSDTPFPVEVIPENVAVSATNPAYRLPEALLFGYNPISGSVGELSTTQVTFKNAGDAGLVRDAVSS
jgi:hypothetical protein